MISQPSHTLSHFICSQFIYGWLILGSAILVACSFGEIVCVEYAAKSSPILQGQCPSPKEREGVRAEITADAQAILSASLEERESMREEITTEVPSILTTSLELYPGFPVWAWSS